MTPNFKDHRLTRAFGVLRGPFPEVYFAAASFKMNSVHQHLHEIKAAAMIQVQSFRQQRIGDGVRIKSLALVRDDKRNTLILFTPATNPNLFAWVEAISVNQSIVEGFLKGQFNGVLVTDGASRFLD